METRHNMHIYIHIGRSLFKVKESVSIQNYITKNIMTEQTNRIALNALNPMGNLHTMCTSRN